MFSEVFTRRRTLTLLATVTALFACGPLFASYASAEEAGDPALKSRFEFLSQNGNVECSAEFEASIATMPPDATPGLLLCAHG